MNNPTKFYSNKQETAVANYLNWRVVTGSGARATHPGDIVSDDWLGECKTHVIKSKTITFKKSEWQKIFSEAISKFKTPVLIVDDGSQSISNTWCIYPRRFDITQFKVQPLPKHTRANIIIDPSQLRSNVIYLSIFSGTAVGVSSLSMFKKIIESGG